MSCRQNDSESDSLRNDFDNEEDIEAVALNHDMQVGGSRARLRIFGNSRAILSGVNNIASLILALIAISVWRQRSIHSPQHQEASVKSIINDAPCVCGNSTAEARAMGCVFDLAATAWVPDHCIDHELLEEFERSGEGPDGRWQWYADPQYTMEMSMDEIKELGDHYGEIIYTTPRWHKAHCFYYWRKLQRSVKTGVRLGGRYNNEGHTEHCGRVLQGPDIRSMSYIAFEAESLIPPEFVKHLLPVNWPVNIDGPEKFKELYLHSD
ncbi:hypothetical protein F4678DRAFT_439429 [Xylaria arbuscula]|nr:hypothetical protein F4678DRAFT_439429 [Xylaria arbuscula]